MENFHRRTRTLWWKNHRCRSVLSLIQSASVTPHRGGRAAPLLRPVPPGLSLTRLSVSMPSPEELAGISTECGFTLTMLRLTAVVILFIRFSSVQSQSRHWSGSVGKTRCSRINQPMSTDPA
ncbi:hypothetical protein BaRGS_00006626 [Batillaria attramentaria]|uniref:Uncharacterized protein n=1 Tax=Batillaria attramentaria TaxID=370345 RepID=A0ABD0LS44_9CAEN